MVLADPIQLRLELIPLRLKRSLLALESADVSCPCISLVLETLNLSVKPVDLGSKEALSSHALGVGALQSVSESTGVLGLALTLTLARSWRARTVVGVTHGVSSCQ
jgi:hypothetical protein